MLFYFPCLFLFIFLFFFVLLFLPKENILSSRNTSTRIYVGERICCKVRLSRIFRIFPIVTCRVKALSKQQPDGA